MTSWDFPCSDPIDIAIENWTSGSIVLVGEPTDTVVVEVVPSRRSTAPDLLEEVTVDFDDGQLAVRGPRVTSWRRTGLDLTIRAPAGSSCAAKTVSADLSCVGELSSLSINTASGDISASAVTGDVTAKSASGDLLLDHVGGELTVNSASGDIHVNQVDGTAQVSSASGDVTIGYCAGPASVRTASGDVELGAVVSGAIELNSATGDVDVAVVPGTGVYLELSSLTGSVISDLDEVDSAEAAGPSGPTVVIRVGTMSGDIHVARANTGRRDSGDTTAAPAE